MTQAINMELHSIIEDSVFGVGGKAAMADFGKLKDRPILERIHFVDQKMKLVPESDTIRPMHQCVAAGNFTPTERTIMVFELLADQSPVLGLVDGVDEPSELFVSYCTKEDFVDTDYRVMSMNRQPIGYLYCFSYLFDSKYNSKGRNYWVGSPASLTEAVNRIDYLQKLRTTLSGFRAS